MPTRRSSTPPSQAAHTPGSYQLGRLLERVFEIDLEHCPNGGGEPTIIAAILESAVIERILTHLGLQARASPRAPARPTWLNVPPSTLKIPRRATKPDGSVLDPRWTQAAKREKMPFENPIRRTAVKAAARRRRHLQSHHAAAGAAGAAGGRPTRTRGAAVPCAVDIAAPGFAPDRPRGRTDGRAGLFRQGPARDTSTPRSPIPPMT